MTGAGLHDTGPVLLSVDPDGQPGGRRLQQTVGASQARQGSPTSRRAMPETASTMPTSSSRSARLNVNVGVTFT